MVAATAVVSATVKNVMRFRVLFCNNNIRVIICGNTAAAWVNLNRVGTQNTCNKNGTSQKWRFSNLFSIKSRRHSECGRMTRWWKNDYANTYHRESGGSWECLMLFFGFFCKLWCRETTVISLSLWSYRFFALHPTPGMNCGKFIVS